MMDNNINLGSLVTINSQDDIKFTVIDLFYDEYSKEYVSLVYFNEKHSTVIELKKVSTKACKEWLS